MIGACCLYDIFTPSKVFSQLFKSIAPQAKSHEEYLEICLKLGFGECGEYSRIMAKLICDCLYIDAYVMRVPGHMFVLFNKRPGFNLVSEVTTVSSLNQAVLSGKIEFFDPLLNESSIESVLPKWKEYYGVDIKGSVDVYHKYTTPKKKCNAMSQSIFHAGDMQFDMKSIQFTLDCISEKEKNYMHPS